MLRNADSLKSDNFSSLMKRYIVHPEITFINLTKALIMIRWVILTDLEMTKSTLHVKESRIII